MQAPLTRLVARVDGWFNVLTGLGRKDRDKRMHADVEWTPLQETDAENLYAADDMAAKIVDLLPNEALSKGFKITGYEPEQNAALETAVSELGLRQHMLAAWILARTYGGAGVLLITKDLTKLDQPLEANAVLTGLRPIQRWELVPDYEAVEKDIRSPNFGMPTTYYFYPRLVDGKNIGSKIHYTRIVRFDGVELPGKLKRMNSFWGDSVLTRLQNAIRNYQTEHDSAASIVHDFRIGKFKIKGLADMLAADQDQDIIRRMELVRLSKSICSAVVLDADSEDFQYTTSTVTGIPELLAKAELRLVSGSRIPHTVLLGESPVGSNATGNSTVLSWYDYVEQERQNYLKPKLLSVIRMKALELKLDPKKADVEFAPLWQLDEKEQATVRKTQADTDAIYLDRSVVDPSEVAASRFGGEKYSTDTKLERAEPTPVAAEATALATEPAADDIQATALNGAQVTAMVTIVQAVALGGLPRESGAAIIVKAFNVSPAEANAILGSAGNGFTPNPAGVQMAGGPPRVDGDGTTIGIPVGSIGAGSFGTSGEKTEAVAEVIAKYTAKLIPRESAVFLIMQAMNVTKAEAEAALGEAPAAPVVETTTAPAPTEAT